MAKRTKSFEEKLWYCGKCVGQISGKLTFYNLPILYQMKVGVLTKKGILFASRPILLDGQTGSNQVVNKEDSSLKKVIMLKDKLIASDTGRSKQRLSLRDKQQLFNDLGSVL